MLHLNYSLVVTLMLHIIGKRELLSGSLTHITYKLLCGCYTHTTYT